MRCIERPHQVDFLALWDSGFSQLVSSANIETLKILSVLRWFLPSVLSYIIQLYRLLYFLYLFIYLLYMFQACRIVFYVIYLNILDSFWPQFSTFSLVSWATMMNASSHTQSLAGKNPYAWHCSTISVVFLIHPNYIWQNFLIDFISICSVCLDSWWAHPLFIYRSIWTTKELSLLRLFSWLAKNLLKKDLVATLFLQSLMTKELLKICYCYRNLQAILECSGAMPWI